MTESKPRVFLCYSRQDLEFAEEVRRRLAAANLDVRIDHGLLVGGDRWQTRIDDAIRDAEVLLLILSPAAAASQHVQYEWAFAAGARVPIVPVRLAATEPHPHLQQLQWVDFSGERRPWADLTRAVEQQIAANENTRRKRDSEVRFAEAEAAVTGDDPDAARKASEWLRTQKGGRANELLLRGLDRWPLWTLVMAVGERKLEQAIPRLVELCWRPHLENATLQAAADALVALGTPTVVDLIEPTLRSGLDNGHGHATCVDVLGRLPPSQRIVDLLIHYVGRIRLLPQVSANNSTMPDAGLAAAAEALGRLGDPRGVPPLIALQGHPTRWVADRAVAALGRFGAIDAAGEALMAAARSEDADRARVALEALAGARSPRLLRGLAELASECRLEDVDARVGVKHRAAKIVAAADPEALHNVLTHPDREGRAAAAAAIRDRAGPESLLPALLPLLSDRDEVETLSVSRSWRERRPLREVAATALVAIGTPGALAALANQASG